MGAGEKALADFTRAIEEDNQDAVPLINRAGVYVSLGDYKRAIDDYSAAIELRENDASLFAQRAVAYKAAGQLAKSLEDYDQAIELQPKDETHVLGRGFVKFQMKNHKGAVADFSKAFELAPRSAVAVNNRGYNYAQLGDEKLALEDYRRATKLAPRYLLAWRNLSWLLVLTKNVDIANPAKAISAATVVCELTEYADFSDLTLLAAAYASAEEFETARGWQEKAMEVADEEQKKLAAKILDLYADDKPLDPALLTATES
jgi:tetratricopeptide (TPR) repeat protein